jgi:benzoyl-CoA reductase/2-hydroxyglutaryl-CoA dehydratase subunit BcrC/BadD/HgdB
MKNFCFFIALILINSCHLFGQKMVQTAPDGLPMTWLDPVEIRSKAPKMKTIREKVEKEREYHRLVYNVRKVYPYALIASDIYKQIQNEIKCLDSKKDKNAYFKKREKELFARWEDELKNFSVQQGRILVLLIDRQLNQTTFDIIKDLKSWRSAMFWNMVAKFFGSNLKEEYEPNGKHRDIEEIIKRDFENT